ncbi:MAG: hypothetical protein CMD83_09155 [Gammaproteobacteria bacterium]|nr:hypothetical protein [Gammaproteobacteria bacterium]
MGVSVTERIGGGCLCGDIRYAISGDAQLHFCSRCGSNLWGATEVGLTSVAAGSLDDPELFQPDRAVFLHEAPTWARVPEGMA